MKTVFCGTCAILLGLSLYLLQKRSTVPETFSTPRPSVQNTEGVSAPVEGTTTRKEKCACCNKQLSVAQEKAKQRQQAREAWAREMIATRGYEEGIKQITAKSPWLAKQIQRILEREKRQLNNSP